MAPAVSHRIQRLAGWPFCCDWLGGGVLVIGAQADTNWRLDDWLKSGPQEIDQNPVVEVAVNSLIVVGSPRMSGADPEHIEALAAAQNQLPPILVHHPTMRVIDGVHRLEAAKIRGQGKIAVRFFYGGEADAFVLAVKSNIAHGLPLSLADRKAAAEQIIASHTHWSDRIVASVAGLAPSTIAEIRRQIGGDQELTESRIGRDGRVRPVNGVDARLRALKLMSDNPDLSLREIARAAGISPETARDIRNRLARGEDPMPRYRRGNRAGEGIGREQQPPDLAVIPEASRASRDSMAALIERLRADPSIRLTETGRTLLRLVHSHLLRADDWEQIADNVPPHCIRAVTSLAWECARMWKDLAERTEGRLADFSETECGLHKDSMAI